jgi:hypothetical protein
LPRIALFECATPYASVSQLPSFLLSERFDSITERTPPW